MTGHLSPFDLQKLRTVGDRPADDYVTRKFPSLSQTGIAPLLGIIAQLRSLQADDPWVLGWLAGTEPLPGWADTDRIAAGQVFFAKWDLDIMAALFCASLPYSYVAAKAVEVLDKASDLSEASTVARRIAETGRMILAVTKPGELVAGEGHRFIREVRLLHAVIRAKLLAEAWDSASLGTPINQEDMLGTLLTLTTVVFWAFARLGIPVTSDDQAGYLHLWAVVGYLLGTEQAAAILDPMAADNLSLTFRSEDSGSQPGRRLMASLLKEMEVSMPWGARKLPCTMVRFMAGDDIANMLGVPAAAWWAPALPTTSGLTQLIRALPGGLAILQAPSRMLGRSLIRMWIDRSIVSRQEPPFDVDDATLARWHIHTSPRRSTLTVRGRLRQVRRHFRMSLQLTSESPN